MKNPFANEHKIQIDTEITRVMNAMGNTTVGSDEYKTLLKRLNTLNELKQQNRRKPISFDTLLQVGGTIVGIVIVVAYEFGHANVSKGYNLLHRTK